MTTEGFSVKVPDHVVPAAFSFAQEGRVVVTIGGDGKVTLAPHMTVDDGAKAFWDAVMAMNPYRKALEDVRDRAAKVAESLYKAHLPHSQKKIAGEVIAATIRGTLP